MNGWLVFNLFILEYLPFLYLKKIDMLNYIKIESIITRKN
jgi:hypothetical protein